MGYAATVVSVLPSVEVLSRKAPAWCLPNACLHRGSVLLPPNLSHQLIEIAYSNRLLDGSSLFWVGSRTCVGCDALARTGELRGPTGAIVPPPDVAGGVLPMDLW